MPDVSFNNKNLELDDDTAHRLMAICRLFREEEGKSKEALEIVRDSVARIHNTLMKGRPSYPRFYLEVVEESKQTASASNESTEFDINDLSPVRYIEYPNEFMELETGIESVFLKRKYRCPMCENAFTAPALKTGSLLVKVDNRTQMEVYTGVRQDSEKEFVDFSLFQIMICPKCLYAAQEKEFDVWDAGAKVPAWKKRKRSKISKKILKAFHENLERRMRIAQKAGKDGTRLFSTERDEDDAAISIDLAADTVNFLIGKVSTNRKSELMYQLGMLYLLKSLQYEKLLEDPELTVEFPELKKKRLAAINDALNCFKKIPDQSVENFEMREGIRFNARKFWAAHELKDVEAFAQAGASLQRTHNQFSNLVKKAERELQMEETKLKKTREDARKAKNVQKREAEERKIKEIEKNMQLIRSGLENYRSVVRVITPIYDSVSIYYDKFREMQRKRKTAATAG